MGAALLAIPAIIAGGAASYKMLQKDLDYQQALTDQAKSKVKLADIEGTMQQDLMGGILEKLKGSMSQPPSMPYQGQPQQAPMSGIPERIMPQRARQWLPDVLKASEKHKVPPTLLASVVNSESAWDAGAVSPKGAQGLGQFMPGTAQQVGLTNPFNAPEAIDKTAEHLSSLYAKTGKWPEAVAAYNAGIGAVQKYGGVPPYPETQKFVPKVMEGSGLPMELAQSQTQEEFPQQEKNPFDEWPFAAAWQLATGKSPTSAMQSEVKLEKIDQGDKTVLIPFGRDGRQIGPGQVFPKKPELQPFKTPMPGGGEQTTWIDPRNPPSTIPGGIVTKLPEGVPQADAGKMQMAQNGLQALAEFSSILYDENGQIRRMPLINKLIGEGRRVESLLFSVVDPIIRAATGAAMQDQEMRRYLDAYTPKALDDQKTIESKMRRMENYLNGYLEKLDPTGSLRARVGPQSGNLQEQPKAYIYDPKKGLVPK